MLLCYMLFRSVQINCAKCSKALDTNIVKDIYIINYSIFIKAVEGNVIILKNYHQFVTEYSRTLYSAVLRYKQWSECSST